MRREHHRGQALATSKKVQESRALRGVGQRGGILKHHVGMGRPSIQSGGIAGRLCYADGLRHRLLHARHWVPACIALRCTGACSIGRHCRHDQGRRRKLVRVELAQCHPVQPDRAGLRCQRAGQNPQQRRFSRTVRADDGGDAARLEGERHPRQRGFIFLFIAKEDTRRLDHRGAGGEMFQRDSRGCDGRHRKGLL